MNLRAALLLLLAPACTLGPPLRPTPPPESDLPVIKLSEKTEEIELNDIRYSPALKRVLVPGGGLGTVSLIDPETKGIQRLGGFLTASADHDDGVSSVDEGEGLLFAAGRTAKVLYVIDPKVDRVLAQAPLDAQPSTVRYVAMSREIWVAEPDKSGIEVFALPAQPGESPTRVAVVPIPNGPQRMVVDSKRGRVYVNMWSGATLAVDARTHQVAGQWANLCDSASALDLDEARGLLFVGCSDGRLMTLSADRNGAKLSEWELGASLDAVAFDPLSSRLYAPRERQAKMAVLQVGSEGELTYVGDASSSNHAHCLTPDHAGVVWLCDADRAAVAIYATTGPRPSPAERR